MGGEGLILAMKDVVSIPLAREYGNEVIGKSLNVLRSKNFLCQTLKRSCIKVLAVFLGFGDWICNF